MNSEQKGIKDLVGGIFGSSTKLAAAAAVLALIALLLPFVGVETNIGFGFDKSGSINGFYAAGFIAWVALLAFIGTLAARLVPAIKPYQNLIDMAALIMIVVVIAWAWFFNPMISELKQLEQGFGFGRRNAAKVATMYPHVGMVVLMLAGVTLVLARRKR